MKPERECVEHLWRLDEVHLSLARGDERAESCVRCGAVRYVTDLSRGRRAPLSETKPVRGVDF